MIISGYRSWFIISEEVESLLQGQMRLRNKVMQERRQEVLRLQPVQVQGRLLQDQVCLWSGYLV